MTFAPLDSQNVVPLVTIGIPTYNRPDLLRRALRSVACQTYPNVEVIVADNATPGAEVEAAVASFRPSLANLSLIRHSENIGAFKNFFSLLNAAHGKYFMWLADDDEISPNFVSALVQLLESDSSASSAAGHWIWMTQEALPRAMATANFPQRSALVRALKFVWRTDDAFFYGLHRTATIRQASFPGYKWPNKGVLINWAYVFLLDMVLRGPVLLPPDRSVKFINHDYTVKQYAAGTAGLRANFMFVARRINVHYLYVGKIFRALGSGAAILGMVVALAALVREISAFAFDSIRMAVARRIRRLRHEVSGRVSGDR